MEGVVTIIAWLEVQRIGHKRAYAMAQLKKAAKKAVVLGMLAMIYNGSKFVYRGERSRKVFHYCLD